MELIKDNQHHIVSALNERYLGKNESDEKRFFIQISDTRPESIADFIFDKVNVGTYRCYILESLDVIFLYIYLDGINKKIVVKSNIKSFGNSQFNQTVCDYVEQGLNQLN